MESVRLGYLFAHDHRAYQRWRSRRRTASGGSDALTPSQLEVVVRRLSKSNPEYIVRA